MRVLILNSTHTKYPVGGDKWIQETVRAVSELSGNGPMICSLDPLQWDLAAFCCANEGYDADMIVPQRSDWNDSEYAGIVSDDFGFDPDLLHLHLYDSGKDGGTKNAWRHRDELAIAAADVIVPVSLRPKGRLMTHLHERIRGKRIVTDYHVPWTGSTPRPRYDFSGSAINALPPGNWLVHWTRASQGYWPGERRADFWRDVLAEPDRYVRSAGDTLIRIVREGRIRGSSWKMPGGRKSVSLTALNVTDALGLMRWRRRYVRYTFEPYGIAIRKEAVEAQGGQAVRYARVPRGTPPDDKIYFQTPGTKGDWPAELEWRVPGDFDFGRLDRRDIMVIVPDDDELKWIGSSLPDDVDIMTITNDKIN